MNSVKVRKFQKKYHHWSDTVKSFDFHRTPVELRKQSGVSNKDFEVFVSLPYSRDNAGAIIVNEGLPEWNLMRDLLLSLDRLPDSLLLDIYRMDKDRWTEGELDKVEGDTEDEMLRKILYRLIPEITWAHSFHKN